VSASRSTPAALLDVLEAAAQLVRETDIAELAESLEVEADEARVIRDEITASRDARRATG